LPPGRRIYKPLRVSYVFLVSLLSHKSGKKKVKRVQVTFTEEQWRLIERFKGMMGSEDAEVVRNIVLAWLAEKSLMSTVAKEARRAGGDGPA